MTAAFTNIAKVSSVGYEHTWTGTEPYVLLLNGLPYREVYDLTSIIVEGADAEEPPVLEVYDSTETSATSELYPPWYVLQWRGSTAVEQYRVEQYVGAAWVALGSIRENGSGYYQYPTEAQTDVTTIQFRVIAIDSEANESEAATLSVFNIRHPDPPRISMAYAGGNVTVSVRA